MNQLAITGYISTSAGNIPKVSHELNYADIWGAIKVRWGIKRESFKIEPGLYAVGNPDANSDVLVTANYKLSFDGLRKNLSGLNVWILVLDTKGVNIWCAAGKGTFSTAELVNKIRETSLSSIVNHRRLIVPQLGATGISAHEVKNATSAQPSNASQNTAKFDPTMLSGIKTDSGFRVIYGPIRASDLKTFIQAQYKATSKMRQVSFSISDRIKLIPNDLMYGRKQLIPVLIGIFLLTLLLNLHATTEVSINEGGKNVLNIMLAYIAGIVFTPILLPFIPAKAFALKGIIVSLPVSFILLYFSYLGNSLFENISWFLIIAAIASFTAMNFTGSSTYTSLSGVKKEMKIAIPFQISFAAIGLALLIIGKLL